ncbi:tryptophan RNA-binding attenuator protein-like protein [Anaeramoeba flamelloides]|uniref:Tryptophan RNA-binding attenuator protein-like protein n=1 Tax=Anaeramoeba flamelloides TaxID=1746091 RepID=A0ABQ8XKT0_9EUKA|nr:tryptophan RNA-binding attenuator protein-like protein [Anaeramoeba flamelloides]
MLTTFFSKTKSRIPTAILSRTLNYQIIGNESQIISFLIEPKESIQFKPNKFLSLSGEMSGFRTTPKEGLFRSTIRSMMGENFWMQNYTNTSNSETELCLQKGQRGNIVPIKFANETDRWTIRRNSFLASTSGVKIRFNYMGLKSKLFTEMGLFHQILQPTLQDDKAFLTLGGSSVIRDLRDGESLIVSGESVVAFDSKIKFDTYRIPGFKNFFFGFKKLHLTKLIGPGKVVLQTYSFQSFINEIISLIPRIHRNVQESVDDDNGFDDDDEDDDNGFGFTKKFKIKWDDEDSKAKNFIKWS